MNIKDIVSGGKMVSFVEFKNNALWYETDGLVKFKFPVPVSDITGEAALLPTEKAMSLMKWIRVHIQLIRDSKESS